MKTGQPQSDAAGLHAPPAVDSPRSLFASRRGRYTTRLRPIRDYLLILVLGAMLPGALLTGILVWRAIANNRATSERRLLESARVDASALDREFDRSISILHALATSPALDDTNLDPFYLEG